MHPSILIVDDEKNSREGLKKFLSPRGFEVFTAADAEEALRSLKEEGPDVVLTDLRMPGMDGLQLLGRIKESSPETIVILFTAYGTIETAVEAVKKGAFHYLIKPVNLEELEAVLDRALKGRQLERENLELKRELLEKSGTDEVIAESPAMKAVLDVVKKVAPTNASVLLEGESGTGKEILAQLIHKGSPRKEKPFVTVHCAALTDTLLSSELFGHEKGAFTGASERKIGRFERAHTGTLFLDEIGEIKEDMQVKMLRVLQNGEFERVGGTKPLKADVRLVCATNKNLLEEVRRQKFREDLYYRINVIKIEVPPLRERRQDIEPLVRHFLKHFSRTNHKVVQSIEPAALNLLMEYQWPGNVRELKNIIERLVVLASGPVLTAENIPSDIKPGAILRGTPPEERKSYQLKDMEKELILRKLQEVQGNKSRAAKQLGISRRTLYRKLVEYKIGS